MDTMPEFERGLIADRVKDGLASAQAHGAQSGKPIGRPRLNVDFVAIRDALCRRQNEPGVVTKVAREFQVSRDWLYKWVIPVLDAVINTPSQNGDRAEPGSTHQRGRH